AIPPSPVLQFTLHADRQLPVAPRRAFASIATHDLPRFATYWRGGELSPDDRDAQADRAALRKRVGAEVGLHAGAAEIVDDDATAGALRGRLEHLASGPADLVGVDLEDWWLEEVPVNRPG